MDAFVTRQPIFDTHDRIIAYEVLHRKKKEYKAPVSPFVIQKPSGEVDDAEGGLDLVAGKGAFVNISREALLEGLPDSLHPKRTVIQLGDTVTPEDDVVAACTQLASDGFRFAIGDFALDERYAPLLRLAAVMKIDVKAAGADKRVVAAKKLEAFQGRLLAERVGNRKVHEACKKLGFQLFQGYHYFRPEEFTNKELPSQSVAVVHIMNLLKDDQSPERVIQEAFGTDPSLSYKLLKLVNSAAMGGRGVDSIGHAMRLLGRQNLHRWLSMLLLSEDKDGTEVRSEIVRASMLRGRMCELVAEGCSGQGAGALPPGGTLFLIGLFSQLDTLLQTPMDVILSSISVADEVEQALLGRKGKAGAVLSAIECYEEADWDGAEEKLSRAGADPASLTDAYLDSVTWANERMDASGG